MVNAAQRKIMLHGVNNAISSYVWLTIPATKIVVVWKKAFAVATIMTVVNQCTAEPRFAQPAAKDPDGMIAFVVQRSFAPLAA